MECPDCRSALRHEQLTVLSCVGCAARFWFRGGELVREGEHEAIRPGQPASPRSVTAPATPGESDAARSLPAPSPPSGATIASAMSTKMRAGVHCPHCRTELEHQQLTQLACPGCARTFWQRGGELVPEGEHEAIETPDNQLPTARARFRTRDD